MADLRFYGGMPSGYRLSDLFNASDESVVFAGGGASASFHETVNQTSIPVVYAGSHLEQGSGDVSSIRFGPSETPWVIYGNPGDPGTLFSYHSFDAFQASGVSAAATVMSGSDSITGSSGGDYLEGYGGNDTIDGGPGEDTMLGGLGDDLYFVDTPTDRVFETPGEGHDTVIAAADYALAAGSAVEVLQAVGGIQPLSLTGNLLPTLIIGNAGNNHLNDGGGAATLQGGAGDDTYIVGNSSTLVLEGAGQGHDTVLTSVSYALNDASEIETITARETAPISLSGNNLDNIVTGNIAANVLSGLDGNDTVYGDGGNDLMDGGLGDDALYAGQGDDIVYGQAGADRLYGDVGNDRLFGGDGNDLIYGGTGNNSLDGGAGNDIVYGSIDKDTIQGGTGNDHLYGDSSNDRIDGGLGKDTLSGGNGRDTFVFDTKLGKGQVDKIVDFNLHMDRIDLKASVFKGIGHKGMLHADAFHVGTAAQDAFDRIIYDPGSGSLFFDRDGTGPAPPIKFATIGHATVSSASFWIV